ncbi:MAG TPA: hypothetical protein DGP39_04625 [Verrucomicrobiales bacterium]|nr:hypothetical protein [Verrucomicrobiales bacterium]|tara:strand:- start:1739 stop:2842 length:1104 start_codon:yes stop_codon:yes gene_type:complete
MPEDNENRPEDNEPRDDQTSSESGAENTSEETSYNAQTFEDASLEQLIFETKELQSRASLVRLTFIAGALAVLGLGLWSIYKSGKQNFYDPAKAQYDEIKGTIDGVQVEFEAMQEEFGRVKGSFDSNYTMIKDNYTRLRPKVESAYQTIKGFSDREGELYGELKFEMAERMQTKIEPAAENIAKTLLVDLQDDILLQIGDVQALSEELLEITNEEYAKLTNSIPTSISDEIEQTLVNTINEREDQLRERFPKLTKEKQQALISRLSEFSEDQGEKVFLALFQDHISEVGKLQENMEAIYTKEGGAVGTGSSTESTLTLLSTLLDLAMEELDTGALELPNVEDDAPKPETGSPSPPPTETSPETNQED